jgi:thiol-disulfide isomerase/thioredoxin
VNPRQPRAGGRARLPLVALLLLACAAAGFLLQRLGAPRRTLHALPAAQAPSPPASAAGAPAEPQAPPARKVPEQLPDIALPAPDGVVHRLAEWQGRPLLINFWATWCEPCRREIPLLKRLRQQRAADRLQVIGIALDSRDAVGQYAHERGIDYPVLVGEQGGFEAAGAFGMDTVLPFSVFADRAGRVITLKVGELHPDEANLILDRVRDLDAGRLSLPAAREAIASGIRRLNTARGAAPPL